MSKPERSVPKISVIMGAYNSQRYIADAIDSILGQTFRDFEFIIINDGSTDRTPKILRYYRDLDSRITVVNQPNRGIAFTMRRALSLARGAYIARMDNDDISLPRRFELQKAYLDNHPECGAVGANVMLIDADSDLICARKMPLKHEDIDGAHMTRRPGAIIHPSLMVRRTALDDVGGYREMFNLADDYDLFLRLAEKYRLANLPHVLVKYRQHLQMVSVTRRKEQEEEATLALTEAYARRGLTIPRQYLQPYSSPPPNIAQQHREWALLSWAGGNLKTARKHALAAIFHSPFSLHSYRMMVRAVLGA